MKKETDTSQEKLEAFDVEEIANRIEFARWLGESPVAGACTINE